MRLGIQHRVFHMKERPWCRLTPGIFSEVLRRGAQRGGALGTAGEVEATAVARQNPKEVLWCETGHRNLNIQKHGDLSGLLSMFMVLKIRTTMRRNLKMAIFVHWLVQKQSNIIQPINQPTNQIDKGNLVSQLSDGFCLLLEIIAIASETVQATQAAVEGLSGHFEIL